MSFRVATGLSGAAADSPRADAIEEAGASHIVEAALRACLETGATPSVAAAKAISDANPSRAALLALATVGVSKIVCDAMHTSRISASRELRREDRDCEPASRVRGVPVRESAEAVRGRADARRARLYAAAKKAFAEVYEGADGKMRKLLDFTVDDHRCRLSDVEAKAVGYQQAARFHTEAIDTLEAAGAATIGSLPSDAKVRLARFLL